MPCYHPLKAWKAFRKKGNGKADIYFGKKRRIADLEQNLNCGQCIGCRLDKSREWALRCTHEAQYHQANSFLTLTFAQDPISLSHDHFQRFMKRLRFKTGLKLQYYMCGEYGSVYDSKGQIRDGLLGRPHFHCIIFGYDFPDRTFWKKSNTGFNIYRSDTLEELWPEGFATTQDFSIEAAAYVARYVTKKVNGDKAERHYEKVTQDGEIIPVKPEYTRMSLNPAIGKKWLEDNYKDCYPKDFVTAAGVKFKPPRYYDLYFEMVNPEGMEAIKKRRMEHALRNEVSSERLAEMKEHKQLVTKKLVRPLC